MRFRSCTAPAQVGSYAQSHTTAVQTRAKAAAALTAEVEVDNIPRALAVLLEPLVQLLQAGRGRPAIFRRAVHVRDAGQRGAYGDVIYGAPVGFDDADASAGTAELVRINDGQQAGGTAAAAHGEGAAAVALLRSGVAKACGFSLTTDADGVANQ